MKTISNAILEKFQIGFEFEIYVSQKAIQSFLYPEEKKVKKETIPKEIREKYGHLFDIKKTEPLAREYSYQNAGKTLISELKKHYPDDDWSKLFKIHEDGSIYDTDTKVGVEMVLTHQNGVEAKKSLLKVLEVLNQPIFATTSNCGLHINVSFEDNSKNHKDLAFYLSKSIDVQPIKKTFGRLHNSYCVDNKDTDIQDVFYNTLDSSEIRKMLLGKKDETLGNILESFTSLRKPTNMNKFIDMMESSFKYQCLQSWEDDRPAIAPKKSSGKNYIEFRATGGKDYHKKADDIISALSVYLKGMTVAEKSCQPKKPKV